ncbi:MAG: DUF2145 domain-containing protein [Pseudomonadota bacterium]|nr:DUF2145 domain-containing protein [Pseudomonadota bacterium]
MKWTYALISCLLLSKAAIAGSQQQQKQTFPVEDVTAFAKQVEHYAAKKGARAFIIARIGQAKKDLPKGVNFTHSALAIYSEIALDNGDTAKGYAIYNLYQEPKDKDKSSLVTDYPVDFFWGVPELTAGIIIPDSDLQSRLIEAVVNGNNITLHNSNYSLISNPYSTKYQNCNEHLLDLINSAIYQTTDKQQLKANTKAYFKPQRIRVNRAKLAMGNLFIDGVSTDDHGTKIYTTTFTSIAKYLSSYDLASNVITLSYNQPARQLLASN